MSAVAQDVIFPMSEYFARYEREEVPKLGERTQKDYRRHLKVLGANFGHFLPHEITKKHVGLFLYVPTGKIHRNKIIAVLSCVFELMIRRWYVLEKNPCVGVDRNDTKPRDRYITDAEFALIHSVMPERIQIAMMLALLTGQRQGDILSLKWSQVTKDGISFRQSKTGKRLRVRLSFELKKWLGHAWQLLPDIPKDFVIRTRSGKRYTSEGFRAVWQRRMRKLMKGYWQKPRGKPAIWHEPKILERLTFHDIRAKTVSDSKSLQDAYELVGHSDMSMTKGTYDRAERPVNPLR